MTLRIKGIQFIAPLVLLLGACDTGGDTGKSDNGGDSNGGDSNGGDSNGGDPETGTAILSFYGHFLTDGSQLTGGDFGFAGVRATSLGGYFSDLDVVCKVAGEMTQSPAPSPCATCDWAFTVTIANSVVSGPQCDDLPFADGDVDGYSYPFGFTEEYINGSGYAFQDVFWYYFPKPNYEWGPLGWSYGGIPYYLYSDGTKEDATMYLPTSYYYYFYP